MTFFSFANMELFGPVVFSIMLNVHININDFANYGIVK